MLTPLEEKLLTLALDPAAQPGEWATAGMKLIHSLRERGVDGHQFKSARQLPVPAMSQEQMEWPGSIVLTFGKNRGKKLAEIDPSYMKWYVENADQDRNSDLILAMKWLLEDLRTKKRR